MRLILDAGLLIGALDGADAHHLEARARFTTWEQQDTPRLISLVNLTEVLIAPAGDKQQLRRAREAIAALGVAIHRPNEAIKMRRRASAACTRSASRMPTALPQPAVNACPLASFDEKVIRAARAEQIAVAPAQSK